jgi:hypothetical protein
VGFCGKPFTAFGVAKVVGYELYRRVISMAQYHKDLCMPLVEISIYSFFDNGDNIRGHLDSYGNLMIGSSAASTMLEIAGTSNQGVTV